MITPIVGPTPAVLQRCRKAVEVVIGRVGVVDDGGRLALQQSHLQGIKHPLGPQVGCHRPAHDAPTEGIQHDAQAQEPGRGFCQDLPRQTQGLHRTPEAPDLLALRARQAVVSPALITIGLADLVTDRLGARLKLASQFLRHAAGTDQLTICRRNPGGYEGATLRHRGTPFSQESGVHQTGATPNPAGRASASKGLGDLWKKVGPSPSHS